MDAAQRREWASRDGLFVVRWIRSLGLYYALRYEGIDLIAVEQHRGRPPVVYRTFARAAQACR